MSRAGPSSASTPICWPRSRASWSSSMLTVSCASPRDSSSASAAAGRRPRRIGAQQPPRPIDRPLLTVAARRLGRQVSRAAHRARPASLSRHSDGRPRLAEAWALNRLADPALAGFVVLLLLESAYDHFDQVLASAQAGEPLEPASRPSLGALRCLLCSRSPTSSSSPRRPDHQPLPPDPRSPGRLTRALGPRDGSRGSRPPTPSVGGLPEADKVARRAGSARVSCFPVLTRGETHRRPPAWSCGAATSAPSHRTSGQPSTGPLIARRRSCISPRRGRRTFFGGDLPGPFHRARQSQELLPGARLCESRRATGPRCCTSTSTDLRT